MNAPIKPQVFSLSAQRLHSTKQNFAVAVRQIAIITWQKYMKDITLVRQTNIIFLNVCHTILIRYFHKKTEAIT